MSKTVAIASVAIVGVIVLGGVANYFSAASKGNRLEQAIDAKYQDNENVLSSGYQQVQGVAGVTKIATEDQIAIWKAAVQGRYGENGSQAVFQMIKEQNPQIDQQLYRQIQQVVIATQTKFETSQRQLQDQVRTYKTELGSPWDGFWLRLAGYPKLDLTKYKIISSDAASDAFKTGKQKPLQLR